MKAPHWMAYPHCGQTHAMSGRNTPPANAATRPNGNLGHVTDTDVVNAIALGLGTKHEWRGADELEWIADVVAKVRPHPGEHDPREYHDEFTEQHSFDPAADNFLKSYIGDHERKDEEDRN